MRGEEVKNKVAMSSPIRRQLVPSIERAPIAYDENPEEFDRLHLGWDLYCRRVHAHPS
jgi:hypothetical protein